MLVQAWLKIFFSKKVMMRKIFQKQVRKIYKPKKKTNFRLPSLKLFFTTPQIAYIKKVDFIIEDLHLRLATFHFSDIKFQKKFPIDQSIWDVVTKRKIVATPVAVGALG